MKRNLHEKTQSYIRRILNESHNLNNTCYELLVADNGPGFNYFVLHSDSILAICCV
ncbi:hypothetical protein P4I92_16470 [Bacillus cereus]